jgi:hypothetical protein
MAKVDRWYEVLPALRTYQRARRIRQAYYGLPSDASPFDVTSVAESGQNGELSAINLNQLGVLGLRIHAMTVGDDLGWQPAVTNLDASNRKQVTAARAVLEYERKRGHLDKVFALAAETALLDTSAWLAVRWNDRGGKKYDTAQPTEPGGQPRDVFEGALDVTVHTWWRTVMDLYRRDTNHDWLILCDYANRYDLAARYASGRGNEGLYGRILNLPREHPRVLRAQQDRGWPGSDEDTDQVPVWTLYHRPTDSVPFGREVKFCDGATVLTDSFGAPWVYGSELPVTRMAPAEWLDTPHGHTPLANLTAPQQALNMAASSDLTNVANGAVARVFVPTGANMKRRVEDGAEIYEADVKPEAMALVGSHPATAAMAQYMGAQMVELAGLNEAAMGRADRVMPGNLAALFDAKAREGMGPFIKSFRQAVEQVGTTILRVYRACAKVPRKLEAIVGKDRGYTLEGFTGGDLGAVEGVTVEAGRLTATSGMALLEALMQLPAFLQNPRAAEVILAFHTTGSIDSLVIAPETEATLIQQENEWMREGNVPPVRVEDDDAKHLEGHKLLSLNPKDRLDEFLMGTLDEHNAQHYANMQLKASGGMPGSPPPPVAGEVLPADGSAPPPPGAEVAGEAAPNLPQMPTNPATGEPAPAAAA